MPLQPADFPDERVLPVTFLVKNPGSPTSPPCDEPQGYSYKAP